MSDQSPPRNPPIASVVFAGLALLAPLPLLVFDGMVPLARFFLLSTVSLLLVVTEGSAGPVKMITFLLVSHTLVYLLMLMVVSRLAARGLRQLPPRAVLAGLGLILAIALSIALFTDLYTTPFGVTPTSNLLGALS